MIRKRSENMNNEKEIVGLKNEKQDINAISNIPLWEKYTLSVEEAALYFRIGRTKLRKLIAENENASYILWNGNRPQIKRKLFEEYVDKADAI